MAIPDARALIGGMVIEAFNAELRERRAKRFAAAMDQAQLDGLCSLDRLESLLSSEAIPVSQVDIFDGEHLRRLVDVQRKSGKSALTVVAENLGRGSTIRIRDVDGCDAALNRFTKDVRRTFMARSQVNVYLTPANNEGFPPHFDNTDVFVLQCLGSKEWLIFPEYTNQVDLPTMAVDWDPERYTPTAPAEELTLVAGDVLYMPRGVMHQAFCTLRESLHLTISIVPTTYAELLGDALRRAAETDVAFRRRVPRSLEGVGGEAERIARELTDLISRLDNHLDVPALLAAERSGFLENTEVRSSDLLKSALANDLDASALGEARASSGAVLP